MKQLARTTAICLLGFCLCGPPVGYLVSTIYHAVEGETPLRLGRFLSVGEYLSESVLMTLVYAPFLIYGFKLYSALAAVVFAVGIHVRTRA